MSKDVYIYGAHVKQGYAAKYDSFEDLLHEGQGKSKTSIFELVHSKPTQKFTECFEPLVDDMGFVRALNSFGEYRRGKQHNLKLKLPKNLEPQLRISAERMANELSKTRFDRICLMNDEVMWQARTGSPLTYRFGSLTEAEKYFRWMLSDIVSNIVVNKANTTFKFKIGDKVLLLEDFTVKPSLQNGMNSWTYKAGEPLRVYNFSTELDAIVPAGKDGKTLIRLPGTGGEKAFIGYGWIPSSKLELIEEA